MMMTEATMSKRGLEYSCPNDMFMRHICRYRQQTCHSQSPPYSIRVAALGFLGFVCLVYLAQFPPLSEADHLLWVAYSNGSQCVLIDTYWVPWGRSAIWWLVMREH